MTSGAAASPKAAYRDANVIRWLTGFGLGLLGDQIYFIALAWTTTQLFGPSFVGLVLGAGSVPRLILLLFGGALADRLGPKRMVIYSDSSRALIMVVLTILLLTTPPSVAILLTLAVLFGIVDALFLPAVGALPPLLVAPNELARLQSMRGFVQRASMIIGAPIAGMLVATNGLAAAFALNAVFFTASVIVLLMTRLNPPTEPPAPSQSQTSDLQSSVGIFGEIAVGIRYVRRKRLLLAVITLTAATELGLAGPLNVGIPLLASQAGWGASGVGLLLAGFGVGAMVSALFLTIIGRVSRAGMIVCISIICMGPLLVGLGLSSTMPVAIVAAGGIGVASGICVALLGALTITGSDSAHLGRVLALSSLASFGGVPVAYLLTGILSERFGVGFLFVLCGGIVTVVGSLGLLAKSLQAAELPAND